MSAVAFHIGYHKTATTWFQDEILPRHPKIAAHSTTAVKGDPFVGTIVMEPDRSFSAGVARQALDAVIAGMAPAPDQLALVSSEHLSGHAATGGFEAFRTATRLAATAPDAKVFFVVREQIAMIESEYRQLVFEGSPLKLAQMIRRPSASRIPGFDLGHYEYDLLADRYVELFGAANVKVFEFSSIGRDPRRFLDQLTTFLEIEPWPDLPDAVLHKRVNASLPRRLLSIRRVLNHFQRTALNPHPVISMRPFWRTPLWILANRLPAPRRPLLDAATRDELRSRYRESNLRLADQYGIVFGDASNASS